MCSVVIKNFEVTLEVFCRYTLDEQVSDILPPQYKFNRLLKNQRIVIGVKQEAALMLTQCVQKEDNFAVHLLQDETSNLKGNESTLFDLCAPRATTQKPTPSPFSAARARKVKIFSE